jgi:hypothetical protein
MNSGYNSRMNNSGYTNNSNGYSGNNNGQGGWHVDQNNDSGYTDWQDGYMAQENQRQSGPDRLNTTAMGAGPDSSEMTLRPRLGSKRGRDGQDADQDGTMADSPPRTRIRQ